MAQAQMEGFRAGTAAFVMPHWIADDMGIRHMDEAIESVLAQTDGNWRLFIVDDATAYPPARAHLQAVSDRLGGRAQVLRQDAHRGPGAARNLGIRAAWEMGAPFVLYLDADDRAHPRRLEATRAAFCAREDVNVVYSSHEFIDEFGEAIPPERLSASVREAVEGHRQNLVEGENAWIGIATVKNYTNLTSCTSVRTSLALAEPFPEAAVSEDAHTWMRYGAHPGRFAFLRDIRNQYRIRTGTASQSRSRNPDFYAMKARADRDGFEQALAIARGYGRVDEADVPRIRARFYVRLALSMLRGADLAQAARCLADARAASPGEVAAAIGALEARAEEREALLAMAGGLKDAR